MVSRRVDTEAADVWIFLGAFSRQRGHSTVLCFDVVALTNDQPSGPPLRREAGLWRCTGGRYRMGSRKRTLQGCVA